MEIKLNSQCYNCGEIIPAQFVPMPLCEMCEMRLKQLTENLERELKTFGEMRRKVREQK